MLAIVIPALPLSLEGISLGGAGSSAFGLITLAVIAAIPFAIMFLMMSWILLMAAPVVALLWLGSLIRGHFMGKGSTTMRVRHT